MTHTENDPTPGFNYKVSYSNAGGVRRAFDWTTHSLPLEDRHVINMPGHPRVKVTTIVTRAVSRTPDEPEVVGEVEAELWHGSVPASDGP